MTDRYQAGGPESEGNGNALRALHHKPFDLGAFTVSGGIPLVCVSIDLDRGDPGGAVMVGPPPGLMQATPQELS